MMKIWIFSGEKSDTMRLVRKVPKSSDSWNIELRASVEKLIKANIDKWTYYICISQPNDGRMLSISMSQCSAENISCTIALIGGKNDMSCVMSLKDTLDYIEGFFCRN